MYTQKSQFLVTTDKKHKRKAKHKKKHKSDKRSKSSDSIHDSLDTPSRKASSENLLEYNNNNANKPKLSLSLKRINSDNGNQYVACDSISPVTPEDRPLVKKFKINLNNKGERSAFISNVPLQSKEKLAAKKNRLEQISKALSLKVQVKEVEECLLKSNMDSNDHLDAKELNDHKFSVGDIVWAKNNQSHWWPAKVCYLILF